MPFLHNFIPTYSPPLLPIQLATYLPIQLHTHIPTSSYLPIQLHTHIPTSPTFPFNYIPTYLPPLPSHSTTYRTHIPTSPYLPIQLHTHIPTSPYLPIQLHTHIPTSLYNYIPTYLPPPPTSPHTTHKHNTESRSQDMTTPTTKSPLLPEAQPESPRVYTSIEDFVPTVIPMLFTNIMGERSFASVLRFARPFFITKPKGSCYYCLVPFSSNTRLSPQNSQRKLVYLPTSLVLWSRRPCFQFMKDALSG